MDRAPGREPPAEGLTGPTRPTGPLLQVDDLAARLGEPWLRIVDVRWVLGSPGAGRDAYDAGHLPGAIFLDLDTDLSDPDGLGAPGRHPLPDPVTFADRLARRGIGSQHVVVAYDDVGGWVAARLWWMLDDLGHRQVAVLDGGYPAWSAAGLPITTEIPDHPPASLHLERSWRRVIERDELRDRLGDVVLLDARAGQRYRGETEPIDPVAGHIPTARNAPVDGSLTDDGRFRDPGELAERFVALGVEGGRDVVTSCGSGTAACHHALAMRMAGLPDPILYAGSYSDWSRSGMPVTTGPEPGSASAT
jgi:thiosulfate/3-mercaptopyruvate sulfurtransferase